MRILADENVFAPMIDFLKVQGHDVIEVRNWPLSGATDDEIYALAVKDALVLLTMDKDFARTTRFPPERCGGIIVVKLYRMSVKEATEIFERSFKSLRENDVHKRLVIITRDGIRFRGPRKDDRS